MAYDYFDKLIDLQKLNKAGLINDDHFALYLSDALPANKLDIILGSIEHKSNKTLTGLLEKYKTGHKRFQTYEGAKTNWKDRKKLANELEKIPLKQDLDVVRYTGWGFLDSIPLADGKILGAEIKRLKEANATEEEIQKFLLSLGPIQNKDFLSTAISNTTKYFEKKDIMYNLHLPEGTKGVYLEDLLGDGFSKHYEAEFLVQKEQFINIKNIRFEDGKVIIDASIIPTKISK